MRENQNCVSVGIDEVINVLNVFPLFLQDDTNLQNIFQNFYTVVFQCPAGELCLLSARASADTFVCIFAVVQSPPKIIKQPPTDELLFQVKTRADDKDKPFIIECEADGEPAPE